MIEDIINTYVKARALIRKVDGNRWSVVAGSSPYPKFRTFTEALTHALDIITDSLNDV